MNTASGDGEEGATGRITLAVAVRSPAGDGLIGSESTRMQVTSGDSSESPSRRITLPVPVVAPTGDCLVGSQPTRMMAYQDAG